MEFFYVYILHNKKKNFIYIGNTKKLRQRVIDHNNSYSQSTKAYIPLTLIHNKAYRNKKDAKRREKYLKTSMGKRVINKQLKYVW